MPSIQSPESLGIWSSRHAPKLRHTNSSSAVHINGTASPAQSQHHPNPAVSSAASTPASHEFARFQHAVRRLRWKLPYLADAHRKAASYKEMQGVSDEEKKEVETMFKLDFYEYYNVLERCLVHLMRVWSIEVDGVERGELTHTYHASLLNTLTHPTNPLRPVLGQGAVYEHLQSAKQLRNRWKNAEVAGESDSPPPLDAWAIEEMIFAIFNAFEICEALARQEVEGKAGMQRKGAGSWAEEMEQVDEDEAGGTVIEGDEMEWE